MSSLFRLRLIFRQLISSCMHSWVCSWDTKSNVRKRTPSTHQNKVHTVVRRKSVFEQKTVEDAEDLYAALVWSLSLTAFAERAPRFLGRCPYRSVFAEGAPHSRDGTACEFTTSACLKHSRDGRACVSITSACFKTLSRRQTLCFHHKRFA